MEIIKNIESVVERLKQGEVLYLVHQHKTYFRWLKDKVWVRNEQLSLTLSMTQFMEQYSGFDFYVHEINDESYMDEEKDLEYYAWREKSQ
jgi:hypothetical protein